MGILASPKRLACLSLQHAPPALPLARARRNPCDAPQQEAQASLGVAVGELAWPLLIAERGVDPLDAAPDADSETGLRRVDAATARAPPCCRKLGLIAVLVLRVDLWIPAQAEARSLLYRSIGGLEFAGAWLTRGKLCRNGAEGFRADPSVGRVSCRAVVVTSGYKLELLLAAATGTGPELADRPAPDTSGDRDTVWRLHASTVEPEAGVS